MRSAVRSTAMVLLVCALFAAAILYGGFYSAALSLVERPGLMEGVSVDGIDVGGLSEQAARQAVQAQWQQQIQEISISVSAGGETYAFTPEDAGAVLVMDEAFERIGYLSDGGVLDRLNTRLSTRNGFSTQTQTTYNEASLALEIEKFAQEVNQPPVNATVHFGDDGEFTFTDAVPGRMLDEGALLKTLMEKFEAGDYSAIEVEMEEVAPTLTKEELQEHTDKMGTTRTSIEGTHKRLTNIRLICEAVNGKTIMPGEVLSLNEATGERTQEKGYMDAPAIKNGQLIDDTGGGVCQLAGTLYNAALLSELEIVERHTHTWPSTYLPIGLDATINWPDKDLRVRNNTAYPVYVRAVVEERELDVSFFGVAQSQGVEIRLESEIIEEIKPPAARVSYDDTRPPTYRNVVQEGRTGYRVKVYRRYYKENQLIKEEELGIDYYASAQGRVIVGSKVDLPEIPGESAA